jgi:hypothetical protein
MTEQVTDTAGMARAIYRRMPNVGRFMDYDDIRQECELRRIEGRARCFAQLYRHIIDLARHFGGRDGLPHYFGRRDALPHCFGSRDALPH